ncbi:hypothetical protein BW14_11145 [Bifidobacterium sp. UTBIF-68]|uniref:ImmA/IrrE family metallo-endopeptidase n=1 Tax=Bifidobacterium sp. UTBIF-68 TaxID=1465262 RepID=UPI00112E2E77|nr:ImmA/IrrE family metallo-endopeptidase [Bifidobacterium sp. UTBIF-68]TPF91821.1 hypothetical protein BW14_11145 [Bifidobacterium sp. UTBIF-68]
MGATVNVDISPAVLDWVLRIGDADQLSDPQRQLIQQWKTGEQHPNIKDINDLSHKLHVPFSYFFLAEPIDDTPAVFEHRTISNQLMKEPSRELVDTVTDMSRLQDWARQDQIDNGGERLPFINSMTLKSGVAQIAQSIRSTLGIETDWYRRPEASGPVKAFAFLRERAAQAQIIIMMNGVVGNNTRRKLNPKEFRAFALVDEYAPLIFVNRADEPATARLFSLIHECVHLWLGQDELYNDSVTSAAAAIPTAADGLEQACNAVAAEILIPDTEFRDFWEQDGRSSLSVEERIAQARKVFPVSWTSVALHARNNGYITQEEYDRISDSARHWAEQDAASATAATGGDYYNTKLSRFDNRLLDHLTTSVAEGRTSYTEAYRLTGTNRLTFPKLLKKAGI